MKKDLSTGLIAIVVMTVFLGLVYPLAITGDLPGRLPRQGRRLS